MKFLLDTHLLLWAANEPKHLSTGVRRLLKDPAVEPFFSAVSIWEIVIKRGLGRQDFQVEPHVFRRGLLDNGYSELSITSAHALAVDKLPLFHKDPFDRILVAQSLVEGITLLTSDPLVAQYPGSINKV